jgi:diguanylate cyclase (GGDEF)-like protein
LPKRLAIFAAWFAIALTAFAAQAANIVPKTAKDIHAIDFAGQQPVIDVRNVLIPYHPPSGAERDGSHWYMLNAVNDAVRPVTRILQTSQPPGIGLRFFPASTRPEILQVASSESGIIIENTNAYGRKSFRITIPPATAGAIAIRLRNGSIEPTVLAWTEPAIAAHNRQLAILLAAVAGLIAAAAAIMAGVAVMTGHFAPRWTAIFIFAVLFTRLAGAGMFDASIATGVGGPYGIVAALACLALVAGAKLANHIVPLANVWPRYEKYFTWSLRSLVVLALLAFVGIPGAAVLADVAVVFGTGAIAAYLIDRGRHGVQTARVVAPSAAIFSLVATAAAVGAFGGFGNNLVAPAAVGGFAAAGTVLLALAIAAGEGIAILPPLHLPHLPHLTRHSALAPVGKAEGHPLSSAAEAIGASQQGVFDLDMYSGQLSLSGEASALLGEGGEGGQMAVEDWISRIHPDDRAMFEAALGEYSPQVGIAFRMEFRVQTQSGQYPWFELRASMLGDKPPATRCLGLMADVTVRKESEVTPLPQPHTDQLTGLGNRIAMMSALEEMNGGLKDTTFALLDIDRFKSIHASLGHEGADTVLSDIAQRLAQRFQTSAKAFRVGGDSFAVLFRQGGSGPAALGAELVEACNAEHTIDGRSVFAPASVGVALGREAEDPLELLKNAELALLQAKRQGGGCARVYVRDFAALAPRDGVRLESELRLALEQKQLDVFYQPIIRLADGALSGFEALLRWHHPVKGLIAPSDFIPHSETSGLIVSLGRFALERATSDLENWQRFFPLEKPLFASVNVSRRQFRDTEFEGFVGELIANSEIAPGSLKLEITESALGADPQSRHSLERLRALGAGLAIDDFGTGLSTLGQLKDLPFDTVKIDRSFLARHGGTQDENDGSVILGSIVTLAHDLKRNVIVEGVENEADAQWLKEMNCEFAQGFHFSPPLPASEALNFIALHYDTAGEKDSGATAGVS